MWKLNFPDKKYQIIYADPPIQYELGERDGMASKHYDTMPLDDICKLPVQNLADENCILFLWCTYPKLNVVFDLIKAWGFTYKIVAFVWSKTNQKMGLGHYTRTNHEFVLLGKKGILPRKSPKVKQWIKAPQHGHCLCLIKKKPPMADFVIFHHFPKHPIRKFLFWKIILFLVYLHKAELFYFSLH